ncbi:MAG TPA: GDSL-type esterase/lipase family protein [Polyangiaceae bacterium]
MPTHLACVGDSITEGFGASGPAKYYPAQLQGLLGNSVQVKNFGHSGTTLLGPGYGDSPYVQTYEYTAATDFVSNAGANAVVSVIIMLGANDSKPSNWEPAGKPKNDQQYLSDYRAMVDHFLALPTKPTVYVAFPTATGNNPCCSIRGDVIHDQEIPLIQQLAIEKRVPIVDLNTPTQNHPEYFGDGVHPTDAGYGVLAQLVQKGLAREPTVSMKTPTTGQMLGMGQMLALDAGTADGSVDFASVEFFEGTTSLGKATATPFTVSITPAVGNHSITATATDTTRAIGTSMAVSFTVSSQVAQGGSGGTGGLAAGGGGAGGGGAGGAAGEATAGSAPVGTAQAGSSGTSGVGGAAVLPVSGAAGTAATTLENPVSSSDSSCSCRAAGATQNRGAAWPLLGLLLLAARARVRRLPGG